MSRVGKKPIAVPEKVDVSLKDRFITVKGSKGTLSRTIHKDMDLKVEGNVIKVLIQSEDRKTRALQGLTRRLINNMVIGGSSGFERVLEVNGIGYRAGGKGQALALNLG
ncbi:MAG: 50S ribosomal protein L6, partial [Desulfosarcina sp.]|nr:50S ribosomal protein L6 [Desulfobacterales bacterium]